MSSSKPLQHSPPLAPEIEAEPIACAVPGENWPANGLGPVADLVSQLPPPEQRPPGSWVALDAGPAAKPTGLGRWFGRRTRAPLLHLAVRCTALLASGYELVCADPRGVAFGRVPARPAHPGKP
jgi:hypothetical protein